MQIPAVASLSLHTLAVFMTHAAFIMLKVSFAYLFISSWIYEGDAAKNLEETLRDFMNCTRACSENVIVRARSVYWYAYANHSYAVMLLLCVQ